MVKVKGERLGLLMIGSSILVIVVIVAVLFHSQQEARRSQVRAQGINLARLLASLPYEHLVARDGSSEVLRVAEQSQSASEFAYCVVVNAEGNPLTQVASPGTAVPPLAFPETPAFWLREQTLASRADGRSILDFSAPVLSEEGVAGYVRVGYFEPGYPLGVQQLSFFATLALPIFLLTPIFYFLVRREIRPLSAVNEQIQTRLETGRFHNVEIRATGELQAFIQRFNEFAERAENQIHELELKETRMLTSSKILSFQKARVESALEALPDATIVLDETGVVTFANSKLQVFLNADPKAIQGKRPAEWCEDPELLAFLARFNGNPTRVRNTEPKEFCPVRVPDKKLSASAYPLFSPRGSSKVHGTLVVCRDITTEVSARQARGEFVAHVAHELKSPLNVLAMYGEQLAERGEESEEFRVEAANVILDEVDRLSTLIHNMLNITQIEMGSISVDRQRVKLGELLEDIVETAGRAGKAAGVRVQLDLPYELSPVSVDKGLFRVAVNNLLTNAIKYTDPGGEVTLTAEENEHEIRISVRDTGVGIAPEDMGKIFDKFFRSEDEAVRKKAGHGLGLSLTKEIVELHHGQIEAQSAHGQGSEFSIRLKKSAGAVQQSI